MTSPQIPKAEVYDIRFLETPPHHFRYYLDTNVLKFVFARTFIKEKSYQVTHYPAFFKRLISNKQLLKFTFTQNLLELFSIFDYIEQEIQNIPIKKYRQENLELYLDTRRGIFKEIENSIQILSLQITAGNIKSYLNIDFSIDLKDYVYYLHAKEPDTAFLTDDYEFVFLQDITIFTANAKIIEVASRFKLLRS